MKILIGFLMLYLIMPYFGIFTFSEYEKSLFGDIDKYMQVSYTIHLIIILSSFFITIYFLRQKKITFKTSVDDVIINRVYKRSILILTVALILVLFYYGAIDIWMGKIERGEQRIRLGFLGFLYNFFTIFLPAGIIAISSFLYKYSQNQKKFRKKLYLIYLLAISIGVSTGFKYTAILIISVGLVEMSQYVKLKYIAFFALLFLLLTTFSAYFFMGLDPEAALSYVFARATSVAVQGTVAVYNLFSDGAPDAWMALLYAFGNKISSALTGYDVNSVEFLKINITRYVGYLTYPKADEALSGAFNLTITNFGEGVYYFGKYYYFIFSLITSSIINYCVYLWYVSNSPKKVIFHSIASIYLMLVVLPWLMGGAIGNLFGIPTFIYLLLVYFTYKILLLKIKFSDETTIDKKEISTRKKLKKKQEIYK